MRSTRGNGLEAEAKKGLCPQAGGARGQGKIRERERKSGAKKRPSGDAERAERTMRIASMFEVRRPVSRLSYREMQSKPGPGGVNSTRTNLACLI